MINFEALKLDSLLAARAAPYRLLVPRKLAGGCVTLLICSCGNGAVQFKPQTRQGGLMTSHMGRNKGRTLISYQYCVHATGEA